MRYESFHIVNFKGIQDLTFHLPADVTTLIGLNESGKTTILEALYSFSVGAEDLFDVNPDLASIREPAHWVPIARKANFNDPITISVIAALEDEDVSDLQAYMAENFSLKVANPPSTVEITERFLFQDSRFTRRQLTWQLDLRGRKGRERTSRSYTERTPEWQGARAYIQDRLPKILYFPNFLFNLPEKFLLTTPTSGEGDLNKDRFYRATFEAILLHTSPGANIETHIIERARSGQRSDRAALQALLLQMSQSITEAIFHGWNQILGRTAPIAQEVILRDSTDQNNDVYLELTIRGPDGYYDLAERSLGFRWFFMFLLTTHFRGASPPASRPLLLLDEPASNLHSAAQALLLQSFEQLSRHCRLLYATHSHHLINVRWLDGAYVVINSAISSADLESYFESRGDALTNISVTKYRTFVVDHPDQTTYIQPVLDVLEYRPSDLEPVPDVIMLEGKSDFFLLRYATEVLGIPSNLHLVPGTGSGSLDTLIKLHVGWGKSFIVLLDGDPAGVREAARYGREYGPEIRGRCVLLPDACGDQQALEAEDLLSAVDKSVILDAVFPPGAGRPTVEKVALNRAIIELYARKQAVPLEPATVTRFEALISDLTARLQAQS